MYYIQHAAYVYVHVYVHVYEYVSIYIYTSTNSTPYTKDNIRILMFIYIYRAFRALTNTVSSRSIRGNWWNGGVISAALLRSLDADPCYGDSKGVPPLQPRWKRLRLTSWRPLGPGAGN